MVNTLHLKGTNYEIGYKHGVLAKSQIQNCLEHYAVYFLNAGMSPGDVKTMAEEFSKSIQKLVPHLHDELRGIAEGAGVHLLDIIALNARSEIALAAKPSSSNSTSDEDHLAIPVDGCTTFAETLENGKQWLAQNWDWQTYQLSNLVLLEIDLPDSDWTRTKSLKTMTEAGLLGKIGINSSKVGVCLNALRATDLDTSKLPLHVLLRLVLECESVEHAQEVFKTKFGDGAACFGHFGLADGSGVARSWEIGPFGTDIIKPDTKGRLFHTNHALIQDSKIHEVVWLEDTRERITRLKELAAESDEKIVASSLSTEEQKNRIFSFLRDEDNYPNSICRANDHAQMGLLGELQTVFSIVMNLTDGLVWITVGRPKQVLEEFQVSA
ncbi:acyl-coenzyme A:6-aminopenicillanic acid acyl-transferase-domain-containing protein [Lipomyces oligophaga]|uniref:acyl-coenzyme A:6-aminopenicillanic acid acyl-transferase-domain-containing protein n=1 Tax=Lipomyces oligophaga TaxID=45792 RepID=UPI0034CF4123